MFLDFFRKKSINLFTIIGTIFIFRWKLNKKSRKMGPEVHENHENVAENLQMLKEGMLK